MNTANDLSIRPMRIISSVRGVLTWCQDRGGLTREEESALVEVICASDHPAYGRDWAVFLASIDIAATVLAGELVAYVEPE
ncbi:MAG TPA: hypothetical protein VMN56_01420 [Casimicrobiaceae bacterium]|nr:hypothetical protein [Casimicrobiaceae bacterium]